MLSNRRLFLASATGAFSVAPGLGSSDAHPADSARLMDEADPRAKQMFDIRMAAASAHLAELQPTHTNNGDEAAARAKLLKLTGKP